METLTQTPVTAKQIARWTGHDPVLARVRQLVLQGWSEVSDDTLLPYCRRRLELSVQE